VKLTDTGEAQARALCDLPPVGDGWLTLVKLAAHSIPQPRTFDQRWVPETALAGVAWSDTADRAAREQIMAVENMALPALARGLVVANSDCRGRVYYSISPAGWSVLDNPHDYPPDPAPAPAADPEASAVYNERIVSAVHDLDTRAPERPGEIGYVPLPVSMANVPILAGGELQ
jgi:hypothetical protein